MGCAKADGERGKSFFSLEKPKQLKCIDLKWLVTLDKSSGTLRTQMKIRKEENKSDKEKIGFMVVVERPEGRKEEYLKERRNSGKFYHTPEPYSFQKLAFGNNFFWHPAWPRSELMISRCWIKPTVINIQHLCFNQGERRKGQSREMMSLENKSEQQPLVKKEVTKDSAQFLNACWVLPKALSRDERREEKRREEKRREEKRRECRSGV
ncbi:hypothetical protein HGM15179_000347 [Zosterops borbonicus]|uniref:Uncharacterized protein n=1 Tax=Zosterops borbonicus TaxID=364589 RepID=A0A8K1GWY5_9PASS|nr:hypothetical protein HGM15179_000347 [Zosterops borbonicus]